MADRKKEATFNPKITVVIGTLNRPEVILRLVDQLDNESKKLPLEIIVIDQSDAANYDILKNKFPSRKGLTLTHFVTPHTCKYLNYGWQHAQADVVLYLDDDVTITEKTLPAHIHAYTNPEIHGVAGRVINDGEQTTTEAAVGRILWYGAIFKKNFSYDKSAFVDFPYGCNMSFKKQTLEALGGFDERLAPPIYAFNEIDMGVRITKRKRHSMLFVTEALVYHHQFKQGGTRNDFHMQEIFKGNNFNYGYFLGKNFSLIKNIVCLLRRLPYQLVKNPKAIGEIVRGFIYAKKII